MVDNYDIQAILNDLKEKEEMKAEQHDGCYELMRETIEAYAKLSDFSVLNYKDLNLVYLTTVGTWSQGLDVKKKTVNESNLASDDKEYLTMLWDDVWERAGRGEYGNYEASAKAGRSIGFLEQASSRSNENTQPRHQNRLKALFVCSLTCFR